MTVTITISSRSSTNQLPSQVTRPISVQQESSEAAVIAAVQGIEYRGSTQDNVQSTNEEE